MSKFIRPSAWGMTPAQRLARLRLFLTIVKGRRGRALEQAARYELEISEIEDAKKTDPNSPFT